MADCLFLRLSDGWALAYDANQWIIQKRTGTRWRSISFIASKKHILWRCLEEKGAEITPEAKAALDALPDSFKEFIDQRDRLEIATA